jgi:hypothetical protein
VGQILASDREMDLAILEILWTGHTDLMLAEPDQILVTNKVRIFPF